MDQKLRQQRTSVNSFEFAAGRYRILKRTDGRFTVVDYREGKFRVEECNGFEAGLRRQGFETLGAAIAHARRLEMTTPREEWGVRE